MAEPVLTQRLGGALAQPPGSVVEYDLILEGETGAFTGLQVDILAPTILAEASCTIDARLSAVGYLLWTYAPSSNRMRSIVLSLSSVSPMITPGRVLWCQTTISASAAPGRYAYEATASRVSDSNGLSGAIAVRTGAIVVTNGAVPVEVSGRVLYFGAGKNVPNITVYKNDKDVLTDGMGNWRTNLIAGDAILLNPAKTGQLGTAISTLDATYVTQYTSGTRSFTPEQLIACDVDGDGICGAPDSNLILNYVAGTLATFPVAQRCGSQFAFFPAATVVGTDSSQTPPQIDADACRGGRIAIEAVTGSLAGQDFTAIAFGDTTHNWEPPACQIVPPARMREAWALLFPLGLLLVSRTAGKVGHGKSSTVVNACRRLTNRVAGPAQIV